MSVPAAIESLECRRLLSVAIPWVKAAADGRDVHVSAPLLHARAARAPGGTGLLAQYFSGDQFDILRLTRQDPSVNFNFKGRKIPAGIAGPFTVRWSGMFTSRVSGVHSLATRGNGPVRLRVNGQLLIDNWTPHGVAIDRGSISLAAGQYYSLTLEFAGDSTRSSSIRLMAAEPARRDAVVPRSRLFPTGAAPAEVKGLAASATSAHRIELNWTSSASAAGYVISRSTDGANFSDIASISSTTYADEALSGETSYTYRVTANNVFGSSPPAIASATTPPEATVNPPAAPVASVTPGGTGIIVSWNDVADESGYIVQRTTDGSNFSDIAAVTANTTQFGDTGLQSDTAYGYRVVAYNAGGSSAGEAVNRRTRPAASTLGASVISSTQIGLTWSGGSGSFADIAISTDGSNYAPLLSGVGISGATSVTGLSPGTVYTFRIIHTNSESAVSDPKTTTATTSLDAPGNVHTTSVGISTVALAWDAAPGAVDYVIQRSIDGTSFAGVGESSTASFNDSSLGAGTQYHYRVCARSGSVVSLYSTPIAATTDTPPPYLTVSLLGSVHGSGDPFSASLAVDAGDVVDYIVQVQLGVELTSNPYAGAAFTRTITNWVPSNGSTSPTAGLQSLGFSLTQSAAAGTIQSDFSSGITGTTTGGGSWGAGLGSSNGAITARGNGYHDLTLARLIRPIGNFDGIASDETPEVLPIASGFFDIATSGTQTAVNIDFSGFAENALVAGYRWRNADNSASVNYTQTISQQAASVAAGQPIIKFNPLTLTSAG